MRARSLTRAPAGLVAVLFALTAGTTAAAAMSLTFSWAGYKACSTRSPAFTVSDVPAGAVRLAFNMMDKDVPSYHHGGGTVAYTGNGEIPAGAFTYKGPCPPPAQRHSYEWTVRASDQGGKALATASAVAQFPP